ILCGIDVPVMPDAAGRTGPLPGRQIQGVEEMPAGRAPFGAGVPSIYGDHSTSVPTSFVLKLSDELPPAHIADSVGQRAIVYQMLHGQRLDTAHLVLADQACRQRVEAVSPLVGLRGVGTRHLQACLLAVLGPFLLASQIALGMRQFTRTAVQM